MGNNAIFMIVYWTFGGAFVLAILVSAFLRDRAESRPARSGYSWHEAERMRTRAEEVAVQLVKQGETPKDAVMAASKHYPFASDGWRREVAAKLSGTV